MILFLVPVGVAVLSEEMLLFVVSQRDLHFADGVVPGWWTGVTGQDWDGEQKFYFKKRKKRDLCSGGRGVGLGGPRHITRPR